MPTEGSCLAPVSGIKHQASGIRHQALGIRCTTAFRVFHCITQIGQYTLSVVEERLSICSCDYANARPHQPAGTHLLVLVLVLVPVMVVVLEIDDDDEHNVKLTVP